MSRDDYKKMARLYKEKARQKYKKYVEQRKVRKPKTVQEWFLARKADRQEIRDWKHTIKAVEDKHSRKAQKKGYKLFRKLQHRKCKIAFWSVVLILIIWLFGSWYYNATRPLTADQQAARDASLVVAQDVMEEGIVLLENESDVLPLKNTKVNVFGAGAAAPIYGGGGAGGIAATDVTSLFAALDERGIDYNDTLYNVYSNYAFNKKASTDTYTPPSGTSLLNTLLPNVAGFLATATPEMPVSDLPSNALSDAASYSDTAVYVISRVGTETKDLTVADLQLSSNERDTIAKLNDNFDHIIILMNTTNAFEMGFVEDCENVDAALWIGAPGEVGSLAVADTLLGNVNPSGHLTDTYAYDIESNPAVVNTGNFQYNTSDPNRYFVDYEEGIYVGYRYYETFVADDEYNKVVQYPFGYGQSYTDFDWQLSGSTVDDTNVTAEVTVTNSGDVAGKDVVQLYYAAPYVEGGVEKAAKVLGGYAKTDLLQPGQSQTVTISFPITQMASYDSANKKAYVLDAGHYDFFVGTNAHDEKFTFGYDQPSEVVINKDVQTGADITNRFDDAAGDLTYLSRVDPEATFPQAPEGSDFDMTENVLAGDYAHQASNGTEPTTNAKNNIKLEDLRGIDYDDPKWQDFLNQFSKDELIELSGNGGYWTIEIERLGIPRTSMYDGPASIRNFIQPWSSVAYPIPVNLSATWNDKLAERVGEAMGAEAQSFNVDAVYAPSLNLHRSPLGGRNFEYYSEDPLIAGNFGAAWTRGLQSTETIAVMKHFAANDQETNRAAYGLYTWANEQSLRELYLRPFEITTKKAAPHGVMSAFNRIGATWAGGSKPLLTDVLRNEWGFEGFVITDAGTAGQGEHFDALQAAEAGNDLMLAFIFDAPGDNTYEKQLKQYMKDDPAGTTEALRNAAHNICYYVLQTSKI